MVKVEKIGMHAVSCNFFEQRFSIIYCTCFFQDPTLKKKSGKLVSKRKLFLQNGQSLQINKGIPWFIVMHACMYNVRPSCMQGLHAPWKSMKIALNGVLQKWEMCPWKSLQSPWIFVQKRVQTPCMLSHLGAIEQGGGEGVRWFVELALYTVHCQKYIVSEAVKALVWNSKTDVCLISILEISDWSKLAIFKGVSKLVPSAWILLLG